MDYLKENGIDIDNAIEILGDLETVEDIMKDFLEEQRTRLPKLEEYKNSKNASEYAVLAHAMKSDSKYLGFTKLIELSYEHELKGKEGDTEYIESHFDELMKEAKRIEEVLTMYLN